MKLPKIPSRYEFYKKLMKWSRLTKKRKDIVDSMTRQEFWKNFKNHFMYIGSEGERRRLFFLPVRRFPYRLGYEYWILPLAPFVLAYYIITHLFMTLWRDFIEILHLLTNDPYE